MRCLGLDLGSKTLGIAISDRTNFIASVYKTIFFKDEDYNSLIEPLREIVLKEDIGTIVLGLPKNIEKIPDWCIPYINYDKIVNDNTNKMKSILESLGVQIIETDSTTKRYSNIVKF